MIPTIIILTSKATEMKHCFELLDDNHRKEYSLFQSATCEVAMEKVKEKSVGGKILIQYCHDKEEGITQLYNEVRKHGVVHIFISDQERNELIKPPSDSITIYGGLTLPELDEALNAANAILINRVAKPVAVKTPSFIMPETRETIKVERIGFPAVIITKYLDEAVSFSTNKNRCCDIVFIDAITYLHRNPVNEVRRNYPKARNLHKIGDSYMINENHIDPATKFNRYIVTPTHGKPIKIPDAIGKKISKYRVTSWRQYDIIFYPQPVSEQLTMVFWEE
jgi:hypothetical protein